jgi:hypothetical protein
LDAEAAASPKGIPIFTLVPHHPRAAGRDRPRGGAYATVIADAHPNKTTGTILLTDLYGARDSGLTVNSTLQPALGPGEPVQSGVAGLSPTRSPTPQGCARLHGRRQISAPGSVVWIDACRLGPNLVA